MVWRNKDVKIVRRTLFREIIYFGATVMKINRFSMAVIKETTWKGLKHSKVCVTISSTVKVTFCSSGKGYFRDS